MRTKPDRLLQAPRSPGALFSVKPPAPEPSPLRTDVAGMVARTERGPVETDERGAVRAVRVEGLRGFEHVFGAPTDAASGLAVRGYFENGGLELWVVRATRNARAASAVMNVSRARGVFGSIPQEPERARSGASLRVTASSPGTWGNTLSLKLTLRHGATPSGEPMADLLVLRDGRPVEHLLGLAPHRLVEQVAERSAYVRVSIEEELSGASLPPQRLLSFEARLAGGAEQEPGLEEYQRAAQALVEEPEPSLLFAPDAWTDLEEEAPRFYAEWAQAAHGTLDRLVLVDPPEGATAERLLDVGEALRRFSDLDSRLACAAALYHPRVEVPAPRGSVLHPTRTAPPSGHMAGLISLLDRERGAQHTPANAALTGAVGLSVEYDDAERAVLNAQGLNTLRCSAGRGVEVWGGRTLHPSPERRFLAHRRLVHRLVRAMRRAAEPLVFDSNTPLLRLGFVRALTSVLLEAHRGGGLAGSRPEESFRVRCDDTTHPADAYDTGLCVAEVELAPATPMELIHITVALSQDGSLRVLE